MIFTHEFKEQFKDTFIIVSTILAVVGTMYLTSNTRNQPTVQPQNPYCPYRNNHYRGW